MEGEYESFKSTLDESTRREETLRAAMSKVAEKLVSWGSPKACRVRPEAGFIARFVFDNNGDVEAAERMQDEIELSLARELGKTGMTISGINRGTVHFE